MSAVSTTVLTSGTNPSTYGSSVTFTATVSGTGTPTGTVQFKKAGVNMGAPVSLVAGVATYSTGALVVGSHSITAVYGGDGSNDSSTSSTVNQVVNAKTLTITASSTSKTYGTAVTFAGTEFTTSGLVAGDSVTSATIASTGAAASAAVAVPYDITISNAVGTGLSNYNITYSPGVLTVNKALLTVTAEDTSRVYGEANPTFTASFSGFVNGENLGTSGVTGTPGMSTTADTTTDVGTATIAITNNDLAAANYSFTLVPGTLTITKRQLIVSIVASDKTYDSGTGANAVVSDDHINGDSVILSYSPAEFADKNVGAGKTVTLADVAIVGGTDMNNYVLASTSATDSADITPAALAVTATAASKVYDGNTTTTATLSDDRISGDDLTLGYTSATFDTATVGNGKTVTVSGISITGGADMNNYTANTSTTTTADITSLATASSTVIDTPTPNSLVGTEVILKATVTGVDPTGTVEFYSGSLLVGSSTLLDDATVSHGSGSIAFTFTHAGNYSLTAKYLGDANHSPSFSANPLTVHIVDKDSPDTVTTVTNHNSVLVGSGLLLKATVAGSYNPTGKVQFWDGNVLIGTGSLDVNFEASLPWTFTLAGTHYVTAHYMGDANNNPSTSVSTVEVVLEQIVDKATPATSTVLAVAALSTIGDAVTLSANVTGGYNATGDVIFKDNGVFIGSGELLGTSATFITSDLAVGTHSLTAEYEGDVNNQASTSPAVTTQVVQKQTSATILGNIPPVVVAPASITFQVTVNGYFPTGTVEIMDGNTFVMNLSLSHGSGSFTQVFAGQSFAHTFWVKYPGDMNNTASVSSELTVLVQPSANEAPNGEQGAGADRGQNTNRANSIARFAANLHLGNLAPGAFGGADAPLAGAEKEYICSIQRSLPRLYTAAYVNALANIVSEYTGRSVEVIEEWIRDFSICADITVSRAGLETVAQVDLKPFHISSEGFPLSKNDTWNKCVTGKFTYEDIQNNPDRDRKGTPKSCADYHTGTSWYHPDHRIFFDWNVGTKKITLPAGYVIKKDEAVTVR